jgi:hypothetical protein
MKSNQRAISIDQVIDGVMAHFINQELGILVGNATQTRSADPSDYFSIETGYHAGLACLLTLKKYHGTDPRIIRQNLMYSKFMPDGKYWENFNADSISQLHLLQMDDKTVDQGHIIEAHGLIYLNQYQKQSQMMPEGMLSSPEWDRPMIKIFASPNMINILEKNGIPFPIDLNESLTVLKKATYSTQAIDYCVACIKEDLQRLPNLALQHL